MKLTNDKNYKACNFDKVNSISMWWWSSRFSWYIVYQKNDGKLLSESAEMKANSWHDILWRSYSLSFPTHLQQFQVPALSWLCRQDANFLLLESEALTPGKWSPAMAGHQEKMGVQEDPYLLTTTAQLEKHKEIWWNMDHHHVHFVSHGHSLYSPVMGLHVLEIQLLLKPSKHVDFQYTIVVGYHEWQ